MRSIGLRLRIFLATMAVIATLLVLTYGVMRGLVDRILEDEIEDGLARARRAQATVASMREELLLDQARSVAQVPHLRAVLDTPELDEASASTVEYTMASLGSALDAALLFVCDAHGAILADTHPSAGRPASHPALARGLAGEESCGVWDYAGDPFLVALSPVTLDGAVLGLVGVGYPLERHAADLRRVVGLDVTLLSGKTLLAADWAGSDDQPYGDPPPRRDAAAWSDLALESEVRLSCDGREYMATAMSLGEPGLELVLSRPLDDVLQQFQRARRELFVLGLALAGLGLLASRWVASHIARPIRELTRAAKHLARGELSTEVDVRAADEIGLLARAFNDMAQQLSSLMRQAHEKARAAEQASEAKSVFLATMSHEIRTPLNGVLGFTEQTLSTELTGEQREYLGFVRRSGQDLLALIDEILDFAKLEAGEMRLERSEFRVASCLARALDPLRPGLAAKALELSLCIDAEVPEVLVGAASRLRQIVANYASNALKFTARGSIRVRAALIEDTEYDVVLRVEVCDTGIGIAPERLGQLFRPFAQLDSGRNREYGGTGLGLAISKELAGLMGGEVGVESAPGLGSTFWFTCRLAKPSPVKAESTPSPRGVLPVEVGAGDVQPAVPLDEVTRARRARARILVAEDNPVNQRVIAVVLRKAGWSHALAEDGNRALELFAREVFDLVLMDCQMPGLDGLEATRRIRALERGARVPILALTANAFEGDRAACLAAGMDDFVAKPFESSKLVEKLEQWLAAGESAAGSAR